MQDALEEELGAMECESGNVEVQWNNVRKCVLDTVSYLVERTARKPRTAQEISKWMNEGSAGMSTTKKERRTKTEERIEKSHRKGQE